MGRIVTWSGDFAATSGTGQHHNDGGPDDHDHLDHGSGAAPADHGRLAPLWKSIQNDDATTGATIFFPESAYLQMKTGAISAPASDYQNRLVALFTMDLGTYQQALGTPPASAVLTGVKVDPSVAHWVVPGTCANHIGYWHLPNIRLVYSNHGTTSSFGVFSLISWRGEWFVVHLGPVPRNSGAGLLDLPAAGPGTPGPGGGC